jgi:hypothetical protein
MRDPGTKASGEKDELLLHGIFYPSCPPVKLRFSIQGSEAEIITIYISAPPEMMETFVTVAVPYGYFRLVSSMVQWRDRGAERRKAELATDDNSWFHILRQSQPYRRKIIMDNGVEQAFETWRFVYKSNLGRQVGCFCFRS